MNDLLTYRSRLETDRYESRRLCLEIIDSNLIRGPQATGRMRRLETLRGDKLSRYSCEFLKGDRLLRDEE
ncbi:hypothetical protein K0M31_010018 [Melipona bicolor]|uniref:Uncharacterized protein n=1 Tax=Melipona bicolor TaxID=60889 RepID=A0AA40KIM8_9HYME|nr:hypothetical protein K0M31_010018 [Melipona bicolor]